MAIKYKKLFWLVIPLGLVLLCFFFQERIVAKFLERSIQEISMQAFGAELEADGVERTSTSLVFSHPRVKNGRFAAERLGISFSFKPFSLTLDLHLHLIKPTFEIAESIENWQSRLATINQKSWLAIHSKFSVEGGVAAVRFENGTVRPIYLDCMENELKVHLNSPSDSSNSCIVQLLEKSEARIEAHSLRLPYVHDILTVLWPKSQDLKIKDGLLHLNGFVSFENGSNLKWAGKASVTDLEFSYLPLNLHGEVKEALLEHDSSNNTDPANSPLAGRLELLQGAHFTLAKGAEKLLEIKHLLGGFYWNGPQDIRVSFEGSCLYRHYMSELKADGKGVLNGKKGPILELALKLGAAESEGAFASLCIENREDSSQLADIVVKQIGHREFELIQDFIKEEESFWKSFKMEKGAADASLSAMLAKGELTKLELKKIDVRDFCAVSKSQNTSVGFDHLSGEFSLNLLDKQCYEHVNAQIQLVQGRLERKKTEGEAVHFKDIDFHLHLEDGVVKNSHIKGDFAGLKGLIQMDWLSPKEIMSLHFEGKAGPLLALLPSRFKKSFIENLKNDRVDICAVVERKTQEGTLGGAQGQIRFFNQEGGGDLIEFGFDIKRVSKEFWGVQDIHEAAYAFFENISEEQLRKVFPTLAAPLAHFHSKVTKRELGINGFLIEDGWFEARNLSLERYLSPFLFQENQFSMKGVGDFTGRFDHADLSIRYSAKGLSLENENLAIDVANIPEKLGECYYNFDRESLFGYIPVVNGSYFEKNRGLLFTDIKGDVILEDKKIHIPDIEAFCNGVYFAGGIDINYANPLKGFFDLDIRMHTLTGKVSEVQSIFSHFEKPFIFLKLPIEGDVALHEKGALLSFTFYPGDYRLDAKFQGTVSDGRLLAESPDASLQEFSVTIDYDHLANRLDFSDIQGTVLVGSPHHMEEYYLNADRIRFTDFKRNLAEFDIWIGDKKRDVVRIAGKTALSPVENDAEYVEFLIDRQLTHFGDVHPESFRLILKDWERVHQFDLRMNFSLKTLLHDLQRFGRTGLFFLSRHLLKEINDIKAARGDFKMQMHYDDRFGGLSLHLIGDGVAIGPYSIQKFALSGKKQKNRWTLDQLQFDSLTIAAEIQRLEKAWQVDFLGLRWGNALLAGLEGEYLPGDDAFNAKVNLFEVEFDHLAALPHFQKFISEINPEGNMKASGTMRFDVGKGPFGFRADLLLNGSLSQLKLGDMAFGTIENVSCHLNTARGITFRQVETELHCDREEMARIKLEKFDYDFISHDILLDGLHFSLPIEKLGSRIRYLQSKFPQLLSQETADIIGQIRKEGEFQGTISLKMNKPEYDFRLTLPEGDYAFKNSKHHLKGFTLDCNPHELKMGAEMKLYEKPLWISLASDMKDLKAGHLFISEDPLNPNGLNIDWALDRIKGFQMRKATGSLSGLKFDLSQHEPMPYQASMHQWVGEIGIDFNACADFCSSEMAQQIKSLKLGQGYRLQGLWSFNGTSPSLFFKGQLQAQDFDLLGYRFHELKAEVDYSPKAIKVSDIQLSDPAGGMYLDFLKLSEDKQNGWEFLASNLHINEFRPSLLHEIHLPKPKEAKPLVFQRIEAHGLKGILGKSESYQGQGSLFFDQAKKKSNLFPLFAIPGEILTRLGLNLNVMNPASGTVFYEIKDKKIWLTKLKDVYSEGKLSKFYLPDTGYQSYIDFLGNLHLQIRLKQYSVLFKFAEMFTITIGGTIQKPHYALQKQPRKGGETLVVEEPSIHENE